MNREHINKNINAIYLRAAIVESILLSCMKGSSFSEIESSIPSFISASEIVLREHVLYLVNNLFISYNRARRIYLIEDGGLDMLYMIYSQYNCSISKYVDLIIKIDSSNDENDLEYQGKRIKFI